MYKIKGTEKIITTQGEQTMVKYYNTNGIYGDSNLLRVEVKYSKGKGYIAEINPCHKDKFSYGIAYCKEYYQYYNTLSCMLIPCSRRSEKKEREAVEIALEKMDWILEQYVNMAHNNGGRYIEIIGEYVEA